MSSKQLTLNSSSKYNPNNGRWTVFIPNQNIWYIYELLEGKIFEFRQKYKPNSVHVNNNYYQYIEIYMYENLVKRLRNAANSDKNFLSITKTEALGLIKLDKNCEAYLSKIVSPPTNP